MNTGGRAQVISPAPYNLKTIVPVGLAPPERVAVSKMIPPTDTDADTGDASAAEALVTSTVSFATPHTPLTAKLFASPL